MVFFNIYTKHFFIVFVYIFHTKQILTQDSITYERVTPTTIGANRYMIMQRNPSFMIIKDLANNFYNLKYNHKAKNFTLLNSLFRSDHQEIISSNSDNEQLYPDLYIYLIPKQSQSLSDNDRLTQEESNHTRRSMKRSRSISDTESLVETIPLEINNSSDSESLASTIIISNMESEEYSDYESEYE